MSSRLCPTAGGGRGNTRRLPVRRPRPVRLRTGSISPAHKFCGGRSSKQFRSIEIRESFMMPGPSSQRELEGVATYLAHLPQATAWRWAFTSHDRDAVVRRRNSTAPLPGWFPVGDPPHGFDLSPDSERNRRRRCRTARISANTRSRGRTIRSTRAIVEVGAVDWEIARTSSRSISGTIGRIRRTEGEFSAELRSAKADLERDLVPRTSPTCRAEFCGSGCNLSAAKFTQILSVSVIDPGASSVTVQGIDSNEYLDGRLRFLDGPQAGIPFGVVQVSGQELTLDRPLSEENEAGTLAELRQGCDHTLATCHGRFANAINFRAEPFLPGNDLFARYGNPK